MQITKPTTKKSKKKLAPQTMRLIRRTHGLRANIARAGNFERSYVTRVVNGTKPPSTRFLAALSLALEEMARLAQIEVVRSEYPQEFAQAEDQAAR
jgi:hypothetical protein